MDIKPFTYLQYSVRPAAGTESAALSAFFHRAGAETDFLSFSGADCPYSPEACEGFLRACAREGNLLLLAYDGDALVGELSLTAPDRQRFTHTRELGIALLKDCCDRGLGTAMLTAALDSADRAGTDSVFLSVSRENARAMHLYEKLGFEVRGLYPRQSFYNGAFHDTAYMVRFRPEQGERNASLSW